MSRGSRDAVGVRRRPKKLWGCLASLFLAFLATSVGCAFQLGYLPVRSFSAEEWRNVNTLDNQLRVQMIDSLLRSGQLDGLSRTEVIGLLGPPDGGSYFSDWDLVYRLGMERGLFSIDSEWLVIRIGRDARVSEYRVVRD